MKCLKKSASLLVFLLAVVFVPFSIAFADDVGFEVDDFMGENANTLQWFVINETGSTFGGRFTDPIKVSSDLISNPSDNTKIHVLSGTPASSVIEDRELHLLCLLLSQGYGEFLMDVRNEDLSFDVTTPYSELGTMYTENTTPYTSRRQSYNQSSDLDANWQRYRFEIGRQNQGSRYTYDTVIQSFNFKQNPDRRTSQNLSRYTVISNVSPRDASETPLKVRMTLRDTNNSRGNIAAYDVAEWNFKSNYTAGSNEGGWVFVPVDDRTLTDSKTNFYLTTEIANHTGVRYMKLPADDYGTWDFPSYWKFDVPPYHWTTGVNQKFYLAQTSHVAPGLVSGFERQYNVLEENKRPLRLQGIDTTSPARFDLYLNHDIIKGTLLGNKQYKQASSGNFNLFEVMAFNPYEFSMNFYDDLGELMASDKEVKTPTTNIFNANAIKQSATMPGIGSLTQFFTVEQSIPGNLRSSSTEGILPLHITINIPITQIADEIWLKDLVDKWRDTGRIEDLFAEKYALYLLPEIEGELIPWNLTEELQNHQNENYYNSQIKVFYDEERGVSTQDNVRGLITVSFIVMLMDGTRDGVRPALQIAKDHATDVDKEYIVIRDGIPDNKWKMTFYVAPSEYQRNNPSNNSNGTTEGVAKSSGSSSCNMNVNLSLFFVFLPIIMLIALKNRERS